MDCYKLPIWTNNTRIEQINQEVFTTFIWVRIMQTLYFEIKEYLEPNSLILLSENTINNLSSNLTKKSFLIIIKETSDLLCTFSNYYTCITQPQKIYLLTVTFF